MVVSVAASQAGDSGLGICYCLFPHGPEAQNVDVSVSRDGRLRTSVSVNIFSIAVLRLRTIDSVAAFPVTARRLRTC